MPYDDIKLMYERIRQQNEYFFIAGATIGARSLLTLDASGSAIAAVAGDRDVVGAEAEGDVQTAGIGFTAQLKGIAKVVTDAPVNAGKPLKAGYAGRAGQMVDAEMVSSVIKETIGTYSGTWTIANMGTTSRVMAISGNAADTFNVVVYAEYALAKSLIAIPITLEGTTSVTVSTASVENDQLSNILGVSYLGGNVGTGIITIMNHGSKKPIVAIAAGQSAAGYQPVADGRGYNDTLSVVEVGDSRVHLGILGYDETNALTGEVVHLRGNVAFGTAKKYRQVVAMLVGTRDATDSVALYVTGTEDDEHLKIGMSLETVETVGTEFDVLLD